MQVKGELLGKELTQLSCHIDTSQAGLGAGGRWRGKKGWTGETFSRPRPPRRFPRPPPLTHWGGMHVATVTFLQGLSLLVGRGLGAFRVSDLDGLQILGQKFWAFRPQHPKV